MRLALGDTLTSWLVTGEVALCGAAGSCWSEVPLRGCGGPCAGATAGQERAGLGAHFAPADRKCALMVLWF